MSDERPAFTMEVAKRASAGLPLEAWAAATAGMGALVGTAIAHVTTRCDPLSLVCVKLPPPPAIVALLSSFLAAGALAWFLVPVREDREALVRAAALAAVAGGIATLVGGVANAFVGGALLLAVAGGLAAPLAMLPALRPEAALEWGLPRKRRTALWLRGGGSAVAFAAAGFLLAFGLERSLSAGGVTQPDVASEIYGPVAVGGLVGMIAAGILFMLSGALTLALSAVPAGDDSAEARLPGSRIRQLVRLSPMLRFDFLAEAALTFASAATVTAIVVSAGTSVQRELVAMALALGALVGVVFHFLLAPSVDFALGRGRLLSVAPLAGSLFPLAAGAGLPAAGILPLFLAGALWAFSAAFAPQRYALLFDLASSRGRLRAAADMHGAKMVTAAAGPVVYLAVESVSQGSGLLVASLTCLVAFALFAPTLGGLGRRQK